MLDSPALVARILNDFEYESVGYQDTLSAVRHSCNSREQQHHQPLRLLPFILLVREDCGSTKRRSRVVAQCSPAYPDSSIREQHVWLKSASAQPHHFLPRPNVAAEIVRFQTNV